MTKEMWQLARMHELKDFGERLSHYENDEMLIDEVDEGFCNMMGYTQSELMIRSCGKVGDLIYPPDYEEIRYQIRKNLKQSGSYTCRYRMRKKDGSLIWVWENGRYEKDDTGRKNIRSLVVDVSREEKTMRERDTTYDNIPGGVMKMCIRDRWYSCQGKSIVRHRKLINGLSVGNGKYRGFAEWKKFHFRKCTSPDIFHGVRHTDAPYNCNRPNQLQQHISELPHRP